jgi:N-carbamoylputrescine amidase
LKVTVCELKNPIQSNEDDWQELVNHVKSVGSDIVLLPEMPFCAWMMHEKTADPDKWDEAVKVHDQWMKRLPELSPAAVLSSVPVVEKGERYNEGFVWEKGSGYYPVHRKAYLPDEEGFWEASWYNRGSKSFQVETVKGVRFGFLICSELWYGEHIRTYSSQNVHLLVCPRATPEASVERWIIGGRWAAMVSGAYCISSNFNGMSHDIKWGGNGWVAEPENGRILGLTSTEKPILTVEIESEKAVEAKKTYPRYIED